MEERRIRFPPDQVSSVTFGGENMDEIYGPRPAPATGKPTEMMRGRCSGCVWVLGAFRNFSRTFASDLDSDIPDY